MEKTLKLALFLFLSLFVILPFLGNDARAEIHSVNSEENLIKSDSFFVVGIEGQEKDSESWMGIYMEGIKVGYSCNKEMFFSKNGKRFKKNTSESWMKVSRLGGNPIEIRTMQEALYDAKRKPLEIQVSTKMSESEIVMKAEVRPDKIVFKSGEKIIRKLPYEEDFFFGIPVEKIIEEGGLSPGKSFDFKILDLLSYSLVECRFSVIGREDVLILGEKMNLWHVKTETTFVIPITIEEWIDESGESWKSITETGFLTSTSIRMSKENALEISDENFDIAFSSIIRSNMIFENPQQVQRVTFKLSGIPPETIENFPFDDGSQEILEVRDDSTLIQTSSVIFKEKDAVNFPTGDEKFREFLRATVFCQSDDPGIKEVAKEIVGNEQNSWRAAKKIAEWVSKEVTPNYDVGFATAIEILSNREGDCSEHTVLMVALCRAVGIPARAAVGIMYGGGIFAYHMWPEVYVGHWIGLDAKWLAMDRKSGEYYTDATHIKFGRSNLDENIFKEMVQAVSEIIGKLRLEIIDYYQDK